MRVNGWDDRDSNLLAEIRQLPSYGIINRDDRMISREAVISLLENAARERFKAMHTIRCSDCGIDIGGQHRPSCHRQGLVTSSSDYRDAGEKA